MEDKVVEKIKGGGRNRTHEAPWSRCFAQLLSTGHDRVLSHVRLTLELTGRRGSNQASPVKGA